ncbi:MAG: hypothetical protein LKI21_07660 [Bifidobacterium crudilactis]|jgi:uncharacterized membrane protein|nr:hypothetical protein [Bifidobacterium crudilactis]
MTAFLQSVLDNLTNMWAWTVALNSGLQLVLAMLACAGALLSALLVRRMQAPSYNGDEQRAGRTIIMIAAWILGLVCVIVTLLAVAAVFAPLIGLG